MVISERLKQLRESKNFSQGDIQARTGLLRCYLSRLENGRTVPSIETLEKLARVLEVPLYQMFIENQEPVRKLHIPQSQPETLWGLSKKETARLRLFAKHFQRMNGKQRWLILRNAAQLVNKPKP
jgi:transcriptional regulator with XRE-family HTH domain